MRKNLQLYTLAGGSFFLIPFISSLRTLDPGLLPRFQAWSILTLCLVIIFSADNRHYAKLTAYNISRLFISKIFLFSLAFAILSLTKATNLGEGVFYILKTALSYSFFLAAALILFRHQAGILLLSRFAVCAGLVLATCGIAYWHGYINGSGLYPYTKALVVNKNLHASALFLLIPYTLYGCVIFKKHWRTFAYGTLMLTICSIALLGSKTVWLAILLAGFPVITIAISTKTRWKSNNHQVYLVFKLIAGITISTMLIVAFLWILKPEADELAKTQSLNLRLALWQSSANMIKDQPLLGVGSGQWRINLPKYYKLNIGANNQETNNTEVRIQRPHNDLLLVTAENGVPAGVIYLLIYAVLIFYGYKIITVANDQDKTYAMAMIYGVSGYFVIAMASFPGERVVHSLFFMLMAAGIAAQYLRYYPSMSININRHKNNHIQLSLTAISLLCLTVGGIRLHAEIHLKEALAARDRGDWQQVINKVDQASSLLYSLDPFSTPLLWYRGMANFNLGNIAQASADFLTAATQHPFHVHVLNNLGTSMAVMGDYQKAIIYFEKALALEPNFTLAKNNLQAVLATAGKKDARL